MGGPEAGNSRGGPRLRVAFVTDIITPYMSVVFEALALQCDLQVIFCSATGTRAMPWERDVTLPFPHRVIEGLTIRRNHPNATDYYLSPRIFAAIAAARPDAVVAAGYSIPSVYASLYCKLTGRPLVVHSDGTSASETGLNRLQDVARRLLLPRASACVANSGPAADRFREMGVAGDRLFLAPHSTRLEPMWAAALERSYTSNGSLQVLGVGRLIPKKGFDRLLHAMAGARALGAQLTLQIVGSGPLEEELRRLSSKLGLDGEVRFRGFVEPAALPDLYAGAGAFAFPSLNDPFGFVLLEAMAAGLPALSSPRAGATADLIVDGETGIVVDPDDIDAMADGLVRLASDEALRARLGTAGRAATLDRTPEAAAAGYVRAVTHSIEHPGPAVRPGRPLSHAPMRLAYLTGRYPAISHTFVTREVLGLRDLGVHVDTFSIWRTPEDQLLSQVDRDEAERTEVLLPATQRWVVDAQRAAAAHPAAYAGLVRAALAMSRPGARGRMIAASWVLEAAALWRACEQRGSAHIHAHLNGTAPAVAALAAGLGNAVGSGRWTWSMTVHGPSEFYDVEGEALPQKVREATFVVCISDFARSQLMAFVEEEHWDKLHVVHCGVDPQAFTPVDRTGRQGPLQLLSVGRLTQVKGQAVMLEALALLAARGVDVRLEVVGDGPRRGTLERIAADLGLGDRVTFAGAVGQEQIPGYYDRADAFVLSSFAEGIPVVLMEAMASELPVVAPTVMGVGELVRDGANGSLARPGRADEYAAAIEALAGDRERRHALGAAARRTVAEEFDIAASAGQLAGLFGRYTGAATPVG